MMVFGVITDLKKTLPLLLFSACILLGGLAHTNAETLKHEIGVYEGEYNVEKDRSSLSQPLSLFDHRAIEQFYLKREGQPYWLKRNRLTQQAVDLIETLENSWQHGLNPNTYYVQEIYTVFGDKRLRRGTRIPLDSDLIMNVEIILTDAYLRYAHDLSGMRPDVRNLALDANHWRQALPSETLLSILNEDADFDDIKYSIEPQGNTYKALQKELTLLVESLQEQPEYEKIKINLDGVIAPGQSHRKVPLLRTRLGLSQPESEQAQYMYDEALQSAVLKFQYNNGLKTDGIIGSKTLYILNQSQQDKILQLIANLERLRWMPDIQAKKMVLVNLPSATLWAIRDGQVEFEMPVIIGRPKRETLTFRADIVGVRLNPNWTVPPTIKKEDILPKLIEDPGYLIDKGMEVYDGYGRDSQSLDPMAIDWAALTPEEFHALRMVQIPGATNPLGQIRILMPNRHNIYLHDTNDRKLFYRSDRAQSSGCIRMEEPQKMANFILEERSTWKPEYLPKILAEKETKDLMTDIKIPVQLLYNTVWTDAEGKVVYGEDIYGRDSKLIKELSKVNGIFIPFSDNEMIANAAN